MAAKQPKLTPALAQRAAALAEAARQRILRQAREDVALVKRRKAEITEAFYDIGEALLRLRQAEVPKALGYRSFGELCKNGLGLSLSTASRLVEIVQRLPRRDALAWGKERALALIELADATPAGDSPQRIDPKILGKLDPRKASARELQALAQKVRAKKPAPSRGRTSTPEERSTAAVLQAALRRKGVRTAVAEAVATKPGAPSKLRLELPIDRLDVLRDVLASLHRRR